jgi:ABC-type polysaccharide/polyol phosphate export permease
MWSIPVAYFEQLLPAAYRSLLLLNPAYPFLVSVRDVYLYAQIPTIQTLLAMVGWVLVAVLAGQSVLGRLRHEIRDVL